MNQLSGQVEVFKTDISNRKVAHSMINYLKNQFPGCKINIDLADCDNVLRIESTHRLDVNQIIRFVKNHHVEIELLP